MSYISFLNKYEDDFQCFDGNLYLTLHCTYHAQIPIFPISSRVTLVWLHVIKYILLQLSCIIVLHNVLQALQILHSPHTFKKEIEPLCRYSTELLLKLLHPFSDINHRLDQKGCFVFETFFRWVLHVLQKYLCAFILFVCRIHC